MAALSRYFWAFGFRCLVSFIPLSLLIALSLISGCAQQPVSQSLDYSLPPATKAQAAFDYRDFGMATAEGDIALLVAVDRLPQQLSARARLLMQLGFEHRIVAVKNQLGAEEYWLLAQGYSGREQARRAVRTLQNTGLWSTPVSLVALPFTDGASQVAGR